MGGGKLAIILHFPPFFSLWCVGLGRREMKREGEDRNGGLDTCVNSLGGPVGGSPSS